MREALLAGSEVLLGARIAAHAAFAAELLGGQADWSAVLRACPARVVLLHGDQDPHSPEASLREVAAGYGNLDLRLISGAGQLLFFAEWQAALDIIDDFVHRR